MKPRTLLVLALVVGVLSAVVWFFERELPSTDERAERAKKVVPVEAADLVSLEIEWNGGKVHLERDARNENSSDSTETPVARPWRMLQPFATAADEALVNTLTGQLTALEVERELAGASRADVGLEPRRGQVTWKTPKANGVLEIGGQVPAASEVVAAASGRTAPVVVSDSIVAQLERAPGEWRSREVVGGQRTDVERVTLAIAGGTPVVLAKSGETLRLESPVDDVADREAVDALLGELASLRVETFLDTPLAANTEAALAAPAGTIEIGMKGRSEPLRIELGGGEPLPGKRIGRAAGQAFVATTNLLASIGRAATDWRSRHWTRFENWRIERVTVDDAVGKTVLERKDGQWSRDGVEIPFSAASDLLYALSGAKADGVSEGAAPSTKPRLTITLSDADGNEEVLTLHGEDAARVSGRDLTLRLPAAAVADIESKLGALRAVAPVAAESTVEVAPANGPAEAPSPEN